MYGRMGINVWKNGICVKEWGTNLHVHVCGNGVIVWSINVCGSGYQCMGEWEPTHEGMSISVVT